ncbi:PQQ-dependent sugar dehydrogenase [Allobranchiibius sp. CTAmp26]|uniref:PQQ-dependent sugar dehydrogenase n=1 Tax=Allobranchiibius sp. CTAmp26 TaxID=2815214 RepID=UPI001AA1B645|nr:PQQ-dependent sugar dehydrogenase [Allobranchiibius sp. CTAmp26]MBO1755044.1 PQQ-dependent sugar dehydrogenase [Allobranchiibius sp. CTAmp26]
MSKSSRPLTFVTATLAALAMCLTSLIASTEPASASSATPIRGVQSGRCLDVAGASLTPGTRVQLYGCHGSSNQEWTATAAGELRVLGAQRCLDVAGKSRKAGAVLESYTCNGGANQHWKIGADHRIVSALTGYCLDALNNATANGSRVSVWPCNTGANQRWTTTSGTDTQPPSVPADPRVSNLTCNSVTFAWNAATDNIGVTAYDVYHDGQLIKSVPGTTLSTGLTVVPGAAWGLYVNARDAAGNVSQASATVPISPPQCQVDTQKPTPPTGLSATASGTTVDLRWTAATDNVGVRAYDVSRGGVRVGSVTGTASTPPATTFTDSGLTPRTTYTYTVTARDAAGNVSTPSTAASATTGVACTDPICAVTQVATDTDIPWGLTTLPNGDVLYTRRDAHTIVELNPTTHAKVTVGTVPGVDETDGEGGLLGLAIAPTFASDHWLYLMHTSTTDNRVVRIKLIGTTLDTSSEQVLLKGILRNKYHNGGRLRFGPDGKLYIATGDAQNGANAQNISSLNGKVLRIDPDGTIPTDNPFKNAVWSYGHRNPQGLAFDSRGRLWEQEFGNSVMDETNLIVKGGNYGWPACEGTSGSCGTPGLIAPKHTYPTADGSCSGIAIVDDVLYVACERGQRLYREVISGSSLTDVQQFFVGTYGRLRTVEPAPGKALWLTTTNLGDKDSIANNSNEKIFKVTLGS